MPVSIISNVSGYSLPGTSSSGDEGGPKRVINTDMKADPAVDLSSVGTFTIDSVQWTTTAAVASTAEANSSGTIFTQNSATSSYLVTQIPEVQQGDFCCVAIEWEPLAMDGNNQTLILKLGSTAGGTDSEYDLLMTIRRINASSWRIRNAYRGPTSWTTAYIGTNPFASSLPSRVVMMLYGSGYSWTTAVSTAAGTPVFRTLTPTNSAGGSLRSRGAGQTQLDPNPPNLQYLKLGWNSSSNNISARVVGVQVWLAAMVP